MPRPRARSQRWSQALAFLGLAAAAVILFSQALDTGFWSPEDFSALQRTVESRSRGETFVFRPQLAGGYPANPVFVLEYVLFGMEARFYYLVNLSVHILNAWIAFVLVRSLLHDGPSAWIAALLFALGVGSYGKNLMFAVGISSLLYALIVLAGTLLYVWNEQKNAGRPIGRYAFAFFAIFLLSLFMRGGTFSLLASCTFYNFFFRAERRRRVLHTMLAACLGIAAAAVLVRASLGIQSAPGPVDPGAFLANLPRYLVLMAFPVQHSELLSEASGFVRGLYAVAPYIRVLVGLTLLSYSIFGIIFGNRAIRFYIGWIYIMVLPFAVFQYPADWLNLRFLYLVSLGFCVLLTSGAFYVSRLLAHRGVRRYLPFAVPAFYVVLSVVLVTKLDTKNERLAALLEHAELRELRRQAQAAP